MKKLLFSITAKDCRWDYYRGHGKGGQHRNKKDTAVRCTHEPSGAVGTAQDERSREKNRRLAFVRMSKTKEFKLWHNKQVAHLMGEEDRIEEKVKNSMKPEHLKVEVRDDRGRWKRAGRR